MYRVGVGRLASITLPRGVSGREAFRMPFEWCSSITDGGDIWCMGFEDLVVEHTHIVVLGKGGLGVQMPRCVQMEIICLLGIPGRHGRRC